MQLDHLSNNLDGRVFATKDLNRVVGSATPLRKALRSLYSSASSEEPAMNLKCPLILILLTSIHYGSSARATLVAYEGFDYGISVQVAGLTGGTGFAPWDAGPANFNTVPSGLSFGSLIVSGRRAFANQADPGFPELLGRSLTTPITSGTVYASFLTRSELTLGSGFDNGYFGLNLEGTTGNGLFIGMPRNVQEWVMEDSGGGGQFSTGLPVLSEQIKLLVVKLDLNNAGTETATLYVDPTPGAPEPATGTTKSGFEIGDFTNIAMNGGGFFSIDEIRIGTTFSSVTPTAVPEPSSFLSIALVGLTLSGFRRWKRHRDLAG